MCLVAGTHRVPGPGRVTGLIDFQTRRRYRSICTWAWAAHGAASPSHLFPTSGGPWSSVTISQTSMARPLPPPRDLRHGDGGERHARKSHPAVDTSSPARPLPSPRTSSRTARRPRSRSISPLPPSDASSSPCLGPGARRQADGDLEQELQDGIVSVELQAASQVTRSRPSSKKKKKRLSDYCCSVGERATAFEADSMFQFSE